MVDKGTWVMVERVVLKAAQRADNLPEDTRKTDLRLWVKGYLTHQAEIGEEATVVTLCGRSESGTLAEINPSYAVDYGSYAAELNIAGQQVKEALRKVGETV